MGPFAHLRGDTRVASKAKVGNFVELKKTTLGRGSKASHLTYLGDATIGDDVNIGAGTITCNFDGKVKNPTVIEDGAFGGKDTLDMFGDHPGPLGMLQHRADDDQVELAARNRADAIFQVDDMIDIVAGFQIDSDVFAAFEQVTERLGIAIVFRADLKDPAVEAAEHGFGV